MTRDAITAGGKAALLKALFALAGLCAALGAQAATVSTESLLRCREATPAEAAVYSTPVAMPGVISPKDGTCHLNKLTVLTSDGLRLPANVFLPAGASRGDGVQKFPAMVFINSWASAEFFEYLGQQQRFAKEGYISLSYTSRGFWNAPGVVSVASEQDVNDVSSALDTLQAITPVDENRIGLTGISYGAGLAMLCAAVDTRVRAVSAMSGWGNLADHLYANGVPNSTWIKVLLGIGYLTGRMDPTLTQRARTVLDPDATPAQIEESRAWALARSPSELVVDALNARGVPVLMTKNWQDEMFTPNSSMALFARLTVPKRLILQPGIHTTAELPSAILGTPSLAYDETARWFARWLKGQPNGVEAQPQVLIKTRLGGKMDTLSTWPAPELSTLRYNLAARGALRWDWQCGCLRGQAGSLTQGNAGAAMQDEISSLLDTTARTGTLPIASPFLSETFDLPVLTHMGTILRNHGVRYEGPALAGGMQIRGIPRVQLRARTSGARGMLVAYLYAVDPNGMGTLITHGAKAVHWERPGSVVDFSLELNATAFDVPAGHRIALVFDTQDSVYGAPVRAFETYRMGLQVGGSSGAALELPIRPMAAR